MFLWKIFKKTEGYCVVEGKEAKARRNNEKNIRKMRKEN